VVRSLEVSIDLRAEEPAGERVVGVAGDACRSATLYGGDGRTGVRAVVRTGTAHDARIGISENRCAHGRTRSRTQRGSTSKRYRASTGIATPRGAIPNTFGIIDLGQWTGGRVSGLQISPRDAEDSTSFEPAGTNLASAPSVGVNALLSLHLDNMRGLDTRDRLRRFCPRSWYRVRGPWQR
jgi:hypothetical protein